MFFNWLGIFGTSLSHILKQKLKLPGQNFVKFSLGGTAVLSLMFFSINQFEWGRWRVLRLCVVVVPCLVRVDLFHKVLKLTVVLESE